MADDLDSMVKGTPLPSATAMSGLGTTPIQSSDTPTPGTLGPAPTLTTATKPWDPLSSTPSSPSMIYLNLLILEASLRAQYLELRARRRHHTFFLLLLSGWVLGFGYALFLAPREDGIGVGGSVYWGVEAAEKVCFMGGVITAVLVWATGIWDRGVRWPRRWFNVSNRGLRGFNCKLVVIKRPWWAEAASTVGFFLTYGLFSHTASSSYRFTDAATLREVDRELSLPETHPVLPTSHSHNSTQIGHEEDLAPGGDFVKLLLYPKPFSPAFRENWENYRAEYWFRENQRRALIGAKLTARNAAYARARWGFFWWLPWHRAETERHFALLRTQEHAREKHAPVTPAGGARRGSIRRGSVSSTRSLTPTRADGEQRGRSGSFTGTDRKRTKKLSVSGLGKKREGSGLPSPLARTD